MVLLTLGDFAGTRRDETRLNRGIHARRQGHIDWSYDARAFDVPDTLIPRVDVLNADYPERLHAKDWDELPHPICVCLDRLRGAA